MSKITVHYPVEQYGFAEIELDTAKMIFEEGRTPSVEKITQEVYENLAAAFKPQAGLGDKDFNAFIDYMLLGTPNHIEMYEKLSDQQRDIVQCLKRALKRLESREDPKPLRDRNIE